MQPIPLPPAAPVRRQTPAPDAQQHLTAGSPPRGLRRYGRILVDGAISSSASPGPSHPARWQARRSLPPVRAPRRPPTRSVADARPGTPPAARRPPPPGDLHRPETAPLLVRCSGRHQEAVAAGDGAALRPGIPVAARGLQPPPRQQARPPPGVRPRQGMPPHSFRTPSRRRCLLSPSPRLQVQASCSAPWLRGSTPVARGRMPPGQRQPIPTTGRSMPAGTNAEVSPPVRLEKPR